MLKLYSNIKRLRKQMNMSQQELAEAVGYKGKSMIAQIENGKVNVPASMITKFAEVFNVSEVDLIGEEPEYDDRSKMFLDLFQNVPPEIQVSVEKILKEFQQKP